MRPPGCAGPPRVANLSSKSFPAGGPTKSRQPAPGSWLFFTSTRARWPRTRAKNTCQRSLHEQKKGAGSRSLRADLTKYALLDTSKTAASRGACFGAWILADLCSRDEVIVGTPRGSRSADRGAGSPVRTSGAGRNATPLSAFQPTPCDLLGKTVFDFSQNP